MAYQPYDRTPKGIVFFGENAADQVYESTSGFVYTSGTSTLDVPNVNVSGNLDVGGNVDVTGNGTFDGDLTVYGDLNVSGVVNQVNLEELLVEDSSITLRSNFTGTPSSSDDASVIVNRGSSDDAIILWDEGTGGGIWKFNHGTASTYYSISEHIVDGEGITKTDNGALRTLNLDISDLSNTVTSINNTDLIAIHDGSATKKIAYSDFVNNITNVTLNAAVTDVLSLTGQEISAVDNNTDAVVGWDDSSGKLTYLSAVDVRAAIDVDEAGTDNSTNVTLAAGRDYLTISGQEITLGEIDISDDTNLSTDGTTITLNDDELSVVDGGINTTQLADGSVTEAKRSRTIDSSFTTGDTIASDINLVTTGASDLTVNLPTAAEGKIVIIKKIDSGAGNVIISGGTHDSVTDTIDGATFKRLYYQHETLTCVAKTTGTASDVQAWYII